ncbi:MAG: D-xylose transporter subunit XylF [Candidatus Hydrogenedentota bacterium]|nr:MAG: D-xylose transporter subunit XylF [Candidatus Hydrogenedentota bacterium]
MHTHRPGWISRSAEDRLEDTMKSLRLRILFSVWALVVLSACGGAPSGTSNTATPAVSVPSAIRIGFILATEQEERYQRDKKAFQEAARAEGAEVIFLSSNNDEATQRANVESLLARNVSVLVVQPVNSDNAGVFVEKAHSKGIPIVAYDRMINHPNLDYYAGQNSAEVGRLQAEAALEWLRKRNESGVALILSGQQGHSVAEEITRANIAVLKAAGVPIAAQQYHDAWGTDQALATAENQLVRNPRINVILCNNSGLARGAVQAVGKAGRSGEVFIAGADADKANIEYLLSGEQQLEIYKDEITLAHTAAKLAAALARGTVPEPTSYTDYKDARHIKTILTPVKPVTRENYREIVVEAGPRYEL